MAINDYNVDPDLNTTISGINIAEGCAPSGINDAIRQLMADVKEASEEQTSKDAEQDAAIVAAQSSADAAQSSADAAQSSADAAQSSADAAKNSVPTGTVIAFAANSEPPGGYLLCNGAAVSRTTYAKLFATIGVSYGAGDGSTTFKLPDMDGRVLQGTNDVVKYIAAGLPEIYGMVGDVLWNTHVGVREDGALYYTGLSDGKWAYIGHGDFWSGTALLHVDASRSSSIYGASDTVQPSALALRYYIKY